VRARRVKRAVLGTIGAILAVGLVVALVLYRQAEGQRRNADLQRADAQTQRTKAEAKEAEASDLVTAGYVAQGQRAALAGDLGAALAYLAAAREAGVTSAAVDIPLGTVRAVMNAEEMVYRGHDRKVWSLEVLRDGQRFVSGGADGNVHLWHRQRPHPVHTWRVDGSVEGIALSADESVLAIMATDGRCLIVEVEGARAVKLDVRHPERASFLALDRTGSYAVLASMSGAVSIVDVARGTLTTMLASDRGVGVPAISPDGALLALPIFDGTIQLRALTDGRLIETLRGGHAGEPYKAQFSPDGQLLAVAGGDKLVSLWQVRTRRLVASLAGHTNSVDEVTWSADSQAFATGARDGTARIWGRDGKLRHVLPGGRGVVYGLSWSADAHRVIGAFGDTVMTWDATLGAPIASFSGQGSSVFRAFEVPAADGARRLLSAGSDGTVRAWRVEPALRFTPGTRADVIPRAEACDEAQSLLAFYEASIALRDRAGDVRWQSPKTWEVVDAWCDPHSPTLLASLATGEVWRVDDVGAPPQRVGLAPDAVATEGRAITQRRDGTIILAGAARVVASVGGQVRTFETPPGEPERWSRLTWSPDQRHVAAQSDRRVVVWDVATGALRVDANGPGGAVRSVSFDHDASGVLIVGEDYQVPRYSLRGAPGTTMFTAAAWAWSAVTVGEDVYLGLDDASIARFRRSTGELLDVLPGFGSDVVYLHAQDGLLWLGTMTGLAVVDLESRAPVGKVALPSSIATSTPFGPLTVVTRGWDDTVSTWSLHRDTSDAASLADEVRCRGGGKLVEGRLVPGPPDLSACAALSRRAAPTGGRSAAAQPPT
jgi:WD40 repeat protein